MRLYEFANAQEQLALWKLISDSVWNSISVQAQAQEQKRAKDAKAAKKAPKTSPSKSSAKRVSPPTPPKPRNPPKKTDSNSDAEAKQKSAQLASQSRQQAQATVKSTETPSTSQQQKQQTCPSKSFPSRPVSLPKWSHVCLLPHHWGSEGACKGIVIGYIVPLACGGIQSPVFY